MSTPISIAELKRTTPTELRKELTVKRAELAKMRMGIAMNSEKNHAAYRRMRRDIARMEMVRMDMARQTSKQTVTEKAPAKTSQAKPRSVQRSSSKK